MICVGFIIVPHITRIMMHHQKDELWSSFVFKYGVDKFILAAFKNVMNVQYIVLHAILGTCNINTSYLFHHQCIKYTFVIKG